MKSDTFFFVALISYLIGSFPVHIFLNRVWRGIYAGSDSTPSWILILFDFFKGAAAVLLAQYLIDTHVAMAIAGFAVVTGHFWSLFFRFRRNPGIAPAAGVLAVLTPHVLPILALIWGITVLITRYPAISTVITALSLPILIWRLYRYDLFIILGLVLSLIVIYHHISGMEKILWGMESRLGKEPPKIKLTNYKDKVRSPHRITGRVLYLITAILIFSFVYLNYYVYRGYGVQTDIIRTGNTQLKYIALTFDDGPDPVYTNQILDILKENQVKAVFFMVGKHVEQYPEVARRILDEGHEIGNHTYSHRNLLFLSREKAEEEIVKSEKIIEEVTGRKPELFRPPRGLYSHAVRDILEERDYTLVLWSLSSRDWVEISTREITDHILAGASNGDIILFHDSGGLISCTSGDRRNTVKALPQLIKQLRQEGYEFITINELIKLVE